MFLQTSADIVRRHPALEPAVRFIDGVLEETSTSAILDPRQLARVSCIDQNQLESAFEQYAEADQVIQLDAFECESCHVLAPSRTQVLHGDDSEAIRCSKCDTPVNTLNSVTVYEYTATVRPPKSEKVIRDSDSRSEDLEVRGFQMSEELTQEERGFLRNLLKNALADETAITNFIDYVSIDALHQGLHGNISGGNLEAKFNSIIKIAHGRHAIGDLLFELSKMLAPNRDDIAVAGTLFAEKYQNAKSANTRDSFFRIERTSLEKLTSIKPFLRVKQLSDFLDQAERRICKVKCQGEDQGTGFLIAEDLVLTCFHVVENGNSGKPHSVNNIQVEFDFLDHGMHPTTTYALNSKWTIPFSKYSAQDLNQPPGDAESDALDYAVLKLEKSAGKDIVDSLERGFFEISTQKMPSIDTPILIAGHPGPNDLQPLSFSMAAPGYEGLTPNQTRIIYKTSTEKGSSGSPVFDHNFNVIGLHHNRGAIHAMNSQLCKNNRGIPVTLIAKALSGLIPTPSAPAGTGNRLESQAGLAAQSGLESRTGPAAKSASDLNDPQLEKRLVDWLSKATDALRSKILFELDAASYMPHGAAPAVIAIELVKWAAATGAMVRLAQSIRSLGGQV